MIRYKYIDLDSFAMHIKNAREQALLFDDKARLSGLNSCEDMIVFIARNKLGTTFLEHNFRNRCCPRQHIIKMVMKLKIGDKIRERAWSVELQDYRLSLSIYTVVEINGPSVVARDGKIAVELLEKKLSEKFEKID